PPPLSPLFPYTTLFRSPAQHILVIPAVIEHPYRRRPRHVLDVYHILQSDFFRPYLQLPRNDVHHSLHDICRHGSPETSVRPTRRDRKSTRLNSSHDQIS